jgi:hypothetical protein
MKDELQQLPGVGPSIAADLRRLGVKSIRDLARRDPEQLYARLCEITGQRHPLRCALHAPRGGQPGHPCPGVRARWLTLSQPAELLALTHVCCTHFGVRCTRRGRRSRSRSC